MIRIRQVETSIEAKEDEIINKCAKKLKVSRLEIISYKIVKKSIIIKY